MLADNLCSRPSAEVLHSSIRPYVDSPDVHAATRTYFNMIYSCSFGDATSAPKFARALIAYAREHGNAATLSRTLRHASIAFEVAGLIRDAEIAATEAFSIAERLGLENAATGAITSLVGLYSRLGQVADAEEWHRRAMHHRAPFSGAINQSNLIGFEVRRALECGWYDDAESLIDLANYNLEPGASLRHRAEIAAQRIHLTMLRNEQAPDESEIEALLEMHYAARCFNWHDYVALVLFEALARQGQSAKCTDLASEYVGEYRRGLSPLLPQLSKCLNRLGIHAAEGSLEPAV
jgi:hypothetical protein